MGDQEGHHISVQKQLSGASRKDGISTHVLVVPGQHKWTTAETAFQTALPWLAGQLGVPGIKGAAAALPSGAV